MILVGISLGLQRTRSSGSLGDDDDIDDDRMLTAGATARQ
jgi:hypothetical protein